MACEDPSLDWKQPTLSLSRPDDSHASKGVRHQTVRCWVRQTLDREFELSDRP